MLLLLLLLLLLWLLLLLLYKIAADSASILAKNFANVATTAAASANILAKTLLMLLQPLLHLISLQKLFLIAIPHLELVVGRLGPVALGRALGLLPPAGGHGRHGLAPDVHRPRHAVDHPLVALLLADAAQDANVAVHLDFFWKMNIFPFWHGETKSFTYCKGKTLLFKCSLC